MEKRLLECHQRLDVKAKDGGPTSCNLGAISDGSARARRKEPSIKFTEEG